MTFPIETWVITAHTPVRLAERVDKLAERVGRSRDWVTKQALASWIDQKEERSQLTREALADVDAGRVINHQTVKTWADSLNAENPLPAPR